MDNQTASNRRREEDAIMTAECILKSNLRVSPPDCRGTGFCDLLSVAVCFKPFGILQWLKS